MTYKMTRDTFRTAGLTATAHHDRITITTTGKADIHPATAKTLAMWLAQAADAAS